MISSPCTKCHKKNQPKEICAKDCKILQALQDYQLSIKEGAVLHAIDYDDEGRFYINTREIFKHQM